ncbi:hypothetical protein [Sphingobium yanoikuyae]|uniref:hypothetical protein n=1 Tax=Sphingobium yanoikuyae TaxID=13690 RepID=UPI0026F2BB11|nr:hypothetical protein [Sphingobium yanoikuyae]
MLLDLAILAATGILARTAYQAQHDLLCAILGVAWGLSALCTAMIWGGVLRHSYTPAALSVIDIMVAIVALAIWTEQRDRRAQVVGLISIALLCCHWGYSVAQGRGTWWVYAFILNAGFVLQCVTAGGGWYGVAHFLDRFRGRRDRLHMHRDGGR